MEPAKKLPPIRLDEVAFKIEAKKRGFQINSVIWVFDMMRIGVVHKSGWTLTVNAYTFEQALKGLSDKRMAPTLETISEENAGRPDQDPSKPGKTVINW